VALNAHAFPGGRDDDGPRSAFLFLSAGGRARKPSTYAGGGRYESRHSCSGRIDSKKRMKWLASGMVQAEPFLFLLEIR